jgi:hypothetical protein
MSSASHTHICRFAFALGAVLLPALPAHAENVQVTVLAILASDKDDVVAEKISEIADAVRSKHKQLSHFALHKTSQESVGLGKSVTISLVDKVTMEVLVNEKPDSEGRITLTIKPPEMGELTYACSCGKYFPVITDYYTANKERLIIAVMAKPCFKGKDKKK